MLHPVLESLFLLKVARGYVSESIMSSELEEKQDLVNYIQNEASDYEVMHLVILGEMPEEKYNTVAEAEVWSLFKENVILNAETLKEDMLEEDIMTIVYEMGPVSDLGYSSAAPILEFTKANGSLSANYLTSLTEEDASPLPSLTAMEKARRLKDIARAKAGKAAIAAGKHVDKHGKKYSAGAGAAAGGLAVAGVFGAIKLVKYLKAKYKAAKTPEAQKAAAAKLKAAEAKLKAKKAKA